jgi:hypothetical protein
LLEHLTLPKYSNIFSKINNDNKTEETWNEKTTVSHDYMGFSCLNACRFNGW